MNPEFDDDQHLEEASVASDEPVADIRADMAAPQTGDERIDVVVAPLSGLMDLPTSEHVNVLDEVHRGLQDALATLTEA